MECGWPSWRLTTARNVGAHSIDSVIRAQMGAPFQTARPFQYYGSKSRTEREREIPQSWSERAESIFDTTLSHSSLRFQCFVGFVVLSFCGRLYCHCSRYLVNNCITFHYWISTPYPWFTGRVYHRGSSFSTSLMASRPTTMHSRRSSVTSCSINNP